MKNKILIFFLIAVLILSLAACGSKETTDTSASAEKKVLVAPTEEDPGIADVAKTTAYYCIPLNIFDRLVESVTVDSCKSELVPGLAKSWEVNGDGTIYTFHIREGALFHNGDEVTAEDVFYTFDRMLNPETEGLNTDFFDIIVGAKARINGESDTTTGMKVLDKYTLEITLEKPYAPFIAGLATPAGSIYCKKATEEAGEKFGVDPKLTIGSGPFKLEEWVINDKIVMSTFKDYWKGRAQFDELVLKIVPDAETARMLFEKGELDYFDCDLAISQIPYFESSDKWKDNIVSGPSVGTYYYCINEKIKPFDNVKVRRALQLAINRENILEKLYYGKGRIVNGIMPPGLYGYNPDLEKIEYNPEKAKSLLVEAGYPEGFDMEITQISNNPADLKINEIVQADLAKIGINVTITQKDQSSFYSIRKTGKLPMYFTPWWADFNDPDNFVYTFFSAKNSPGRSFNYVNKEVQDLIEKARIMTNTEERIKLYQQLEKTIVQEDAAWIPLFELDHLFVVQPYVKNFTIAWNGWSDQSYYEIVIDK